MVPISFGEFIPKDKRPLNNKFTIMSVIPNDICCTPRYVKFYMDRGASMFMIHNFNISINKFNTREPFGNKWLMIARSFLISCEAKVKIKL